MSELADLLLRIRSEGVVSSNTQLKELTNTAQKTESGFAKLTSRWREMLGVLAALTGSLVAARRALSVLMEYNTGLVNISNKADFTTKQLENLGEAMLGISVRGQASIKTMLDLATTAAQVGIKGTPAISKFAETMAKLGTVTPIAGDQGARSMFRLLQVTNSTTDQLGVAANVITEMGNKFAVTEDQVLGAALALSTITTAFRITTTDTIALGAAFSQLGLRSERSIIPLQKLFSAMRAGATGDVDKLNAILRVTGQSADEFTEMFSTNRTTALITFLNGLKEMSARGESVDMAFKKLGLSGDMSARVLLLLSRQVGEVERALRLARAEAENQVALTGDYDRVAASLAGRLTQLGNTLQGVTLRLRGSTGAIAQFIDKVNQVVLALTGLSTEADNLPVWAERTASAIKALGAAVLVVGSAAAIEGIRRLTVAIKGLALAAMLTPVGLALTAISAIVVSVVYLLDIFKDKVVVLGGESYRVGTLVQATIQVISELLATTLGTMWEDASAFISDSWDAIKNLGSNLATFWKTLVSMNKQALLSVGVDLDAFISKFTRDLRTLVNGAIGLVVGLSDVIADRFNFVGRLSAILAQSIIANVKRLQDMVAILANPGTPQDMLTNHLPRLAVIASAAQQDIADTGKKLLVEVGRTAAGAGKLIDEAMKTDYIGQTDPAAAWSAFLQVLNSSYGTITKLGGSFDMLFTGWSSVGALILERAREIKRAGEETEDAFPSTLPAVMEDVADEMQQLGAYAIKATENIQGLAGAFDELAKKLDQLNVETTVLDRLALTGGKDPSLQERLGLQVGIDRQIDRVFSALSKVGSEFERTEVLSTLQNVVRVIDDLGDATASDLIIKIRTKIDEGDVVTAEQLLRDLSSRMNNIVARAFAARDSALARSRINDRMSELNNEISLIGLAPEARERAIVMRELQQDAALGFADDEARAQQVLAEFTRKLEVLKRARELEEIAQGVGTAFSDAFTEITFGVKSATEALRDFAQQVTRLVFNQLVAQPLASAVTGGLGSVFGGMFGGAGGGAVGTSGVNVNDAIAGPMGNALGNAFHRGRVIAYANGGVVTRPTLFPLAGGRTGLMGEAGPEGILPLGRDAQGRLGVRSESSGSRDVNVFMTVVTPNADSFRRSSEQVRRGLAAEVR